MRTRTQRALTVLVLVLVCLAAIATTAAAAGAATATPSKKDVAAATAVIAKVVKLRASGRNGPAYDLLVPAQQALISRDDYIANCGAPSLGSVTIDKIEAKKARYETVTIPGTATDQQSLALTLAVTASQGKKTETQPISTHAFRTTKGWAWAMTQDQLDQCGVTTPTP